MSSVCCKDTECRLHTGQTKRSRARCVRRGTKTGITLTTSPFQEELVAYAHEITMFAETERASTRITTYIDLGLELDMLVHFNRIVFLIFFIEVLVEVFFIFEDHITLEKHGAIIGNPRPTELPVTPHLFLTGL